MPLVLIGALTLGSCGSKGSVVDQLKISDFTGKTFTDDGIGEVTLKSVSDGDTAYFMDGSNGYNVRFKGVDTPESTGIVEKWGVPASLNTKEVLKSAVSIVLESVGDKPVSDGTTGRYLAYVWYKADEDSDYKNYCLELVALGYSENREEKSDEYYQYFVDAEAEAKSKKLHLWSNDEDEYFPKESVKVTLKDIIGHEEEYMYKMVEFEAYITRVESKYVYVESIVDSVVYSYTIYQGYSAFPGSFQIGNLINFVGYVQQYQDNYQIAGIRVYGSNPEPYSKLVKAGYYLTFGTASGYGLSYSFDKLLVKTVELEDGVYQVTGTANRLNSTDKVNVVFTVKDDGSLDLTNYIGKQITIKRGIAEAGTAADATDIQFSVISLKDII